MCEVASCPVCYPSYPFLSSLLFPPPPLIHTVTKWVAGGESQLFHSLTHSLTRSLRVVKTFEAPGSRLVPTLQPSSALHHDQ